jgi:hypothetical protein
VQFYSTQTANFDPFPTQQLPFFLQRPGIDYGLEQKIVQNDGLTGWNPIPKAIF